MVDYFEAVRSALEFHFIRWWREYMLVVLCAFVLLALCRTLVSAPGAFPVGEIVVVPQGAALDEVATLLKAKNFIGSTAVFKVLARVTGSAERLQTGPYRFAHPEGVFGVWRAVTSGDFGIPPARITIPEGETNAEISARVARALPGISSSDFLEAAAGKQGYLFPDTYRFLANATTDSVTRALRDNFDTRLETISQNLSASEHSIHDLVIMASLLEGETKTPEDRRIVAGILWRRISIGMALQVDAAPDTYLHTGLPVEPINNPGLDAIVAAAEPTKSAYLYYLTGNDGLMHYAKTFDQHKANLAKYLK